MDTTDVLDSAQPGQPSQPPVHRRSTALVGVAAVAAIAVTAAVAGPHLWSAATGSSGSLPPLAIGLPFSGGGTSIDIGKPAGAGAAGNGAAAPYRLTGTLPSGPDQAPVQRLTAGSVDEAVVVRLAQALGLSGQPVKRGADWNVASGGAQLTVYAAAGHPWVFARRDATACPPLPLDGYGGPTSAVGCVAVDLPAVAKNAGGPNPVTPPKPLSAQALRTVGQPVLDATGLTFDSVRAAYDTVLAEPVIAGLPTLGATTVVSADAAGIRTATGWLLATAEGATYPLRSAKSVFDELASEPIIRPAIACAPQPDASAPTCPTPEDQQQDISGARLGLTMAWERDVPLLVPAWLFEIAPDPAAGATNNGDPGLLARVAVATKYLAPAEPPNPGTGGGTSGSGGSAGSGSAGGSTTDGSPGSAPAGPSENTVGPAPEPVPTAKPTS